MGGQLEASGKGYRLVRCERVNSGKNWQTRFKGVRYREYRSLARSQFMIETVGALNRSCPRLIGGRGVPDLCTHGP
jgi:hypothetical protein